MSSWVHICPWCGWSRPGDSGTMLKPHCGDCGGLLEAAPAGRPQAPDSTFRVAPPQLSPAFGRILRFALVGLLMYASGRFGWESGGLGLALAGVGVVGLFTVPLIVGE